ncbi:MAG: glycosyltransferase family 2 protein [Sphingomonas sp.]|uniref:glycosyltransferase family 2 protein n=1 Tax=Sphingomonas sp. TaxID=28214 RepID=UPI001AFD9BFD|nr:glycosyltransferase [Sphingomonas sp.]MBO9623521.1 glycosyltransferase family 2 protein [Sphingomonas sp.]
MSAPAVSVIMAAYNGAAFVTETIDSLFAQSFGDFELIVVDDCSTDDTRAVLARFDDPRIRVIAAEVNQGPVHARNRAFAEARGRYIAGLDQDDICLPHRFERQIAWLDAHPETVLVGSRALLLEDGETARWPGPDDLTSAMIDWLMLVQNPLVWSSVMFRADAARRLDPFERPELRYAEDFDLYHRLRRFGTLDRIEEELLLYRCHPGGASQKYRETMGASAARVLEEHYAPVFGDEAPSRAALVVRHFFARDPVPDRATLERLADTLAALHRHFVATRDLDPETRARIDGEHARLWWLVARPAIRRGTIGLRHALATRPAGAAPARTDQFLSAVVGQARALRIGAAH